jgi:hypothetical protein
VRTHITLFPNPNSQVQSHTTRQLHSGQKHTIPELIAPSAVPIAPFLESQVHSEMKGAEKKERISNANVGQVPAQTAEEGEAAGYCWLGGVQSAEARRRTRHSSRGGSRRRVATPRAEGQENIAQVTGGERVVASARAPHDGCTGAATTHGGDMGRAAGAGRLTTSVPAPARGWGRICRG